MPDTTPARKVLDWLPAIVVVGTCSGLFAVSRADIQTLKEQRTEDRRDLQKILDDIRTDGKTRDALLFEIRDRLTRLEAKVVK